MLLDKTSIVLPALCSAHSHAFQRGMRGKAQRSLRSTDGPERCPNQDDFWSWRQAMYSLAETLTPESMFSIARVAYRELYSWGVRTVGEFHYLHHQPDGQPYDDRNQLADAVIEAARAEGLRIALLRVIYQRAGVDQPPAGAQRRFCDARLDDALSDIDDLRARYAEADDVKIGIAPHSVRALPPEWLPDVAAFAAQRDLPIHMHVAEQLAEISSCLAETGLRPVELLADKGVLSRRFVAVHATHLSEAEATLLGESNSWVCLCPTTERDLGDGLPNVSALLASGVRLCTGVDSHVMSNSLEDMRAIELGERLRTQKRVVLDFDSDEELPTTAAALWYAGSTGGAIACGFADAGGTISLDRAAPELELVDDEDLLDAIVFSGSARLFQGS